VLFNSLDFAIFLPLVFFLYWFVFCSDVKKQNITILISSYVFYGWWDYRFLILIFFSSIVDYFLGIRLEKEKTHSKRKKLLLASVFVNIGLLGFFKYFNFFIDNFKQAFLFFGNQIDTPSLSIILPVGISFYTFQTLSYTIDIYNKKLKATTDFISFASFVSFFPQLVAGPIERAKNLLPQFHIKRKFDYSSSVDGMRQILWGLFKKIVIADNCAEYSDLIFNSYYDHSGSTLVLGAFFFSIQIYCDFSGYSDIAIGTARLFNFNLRKNFSFPYFSRDIAEFWRKWHISLSTWFRDYVYIPLGGSRLGKKKQIRNTFIIFVVSGFWHGANWTFIVWGFLNALYFLPLLLLEKNRTYLDTVAEGRLLPKFSEFLKIISTFGLTLIAWIFFRSKNIVEAFEYIAIIFSKTLFSVPKYLTNDAGNILILVFIFLLVEWIARDHEFAIEKNLNKLNKPFRWIVYLSIIILMIAFNGKDQQFIYFQF